MSTKSVMGTTATGRPRNRSWPEALKREIVAASFAPGSSVSMVARHYDVNANQVFSWRKRFRDAPRAPAVLSAPQLIPVTVTAEPASVAAEPSTVAAANPANPSPSVAQAKTAVVSGQLKRKGGPLKKPASTHPLPCFCLRRQFVCGVNVGSDFNSTATAEGLWLGRTTNRGMHLASFCWGPLPKTLQAAQELLTRYPQDNLRSGQKPIKRPSVVYSASATWLVPPTPQSPLARAALPKRSLQ